MKRLQTQLRSRIRSLERGLAQAALPDAQKVHECRQLIKQSRAILRLLRPALEGRLFDALDGELRQLAAHLRGARDRTVILETLSGIGAERAYMLPAVRDIERYWRSHFRGLRPPQPQPAEVLAARRRLQNVSTLIGSQGLRTPDESTVRRELVRCYRKARRAWKQAARTGAAEDWHICRKHTKYLDYQLGSVAASGTRVSSLRQQAHQLGSMLGQAHDLVDLRASLRQSQAAERPSGAAILLSLSTREERLLHRAGKLARRLYARKGTEFERLLSAPRQRLSRAAAHSSGQAGSTTRRSDARARHVLSAR